MTSENLIKEINDYSVDNASFSNETFINLQIFQDVNQKTLWFDNCIFNGRVELIKIHSCNGLHFNNCRFNDEFKISSISMYANDNKTTSINGAIVFKSSTFANDLHISGPGIIQNDIRISDCMFDRNLIINNLNVGSILIKNCTINKLFQLQKIKIDEKLFINTISVGLICDFSKISAVSIDIIGDSNFKNGVYVQEISLNDDLTIHHCNFQQEVSFKQISIGGSVRLTNSNFERDILFYLVNPADSIGFFSVSNCFFLTALSVFGDILSERTIINQVEIIISSHSSGTITIGSIIITELYLTGFNNGSNLHFEYLKVSNICIQNFINNAGFSFSNIESNPGDTILKLINNNFGKALFFSSNFDTFNNVIAENNILTEIASSQMQWFSNNKLNHDALINVLNKYKNAIEEDTNLKSYYKGQLIKIYTTKQEIFRQLKLAAQKQGNTPELLEFGKLEMSNYRKSLLVPHTIAKLDRRLRQLKYNRYTKIASGLDHFGEKFILITNQTNNYGQNWLKALVLFFPISAFLSIPISLINGQWFNLKYWLIIINPAHSIRDLYELGNSIPIDLLVWDIINRIIVAYFIFQIITAFRKFHK